jgi:hypothetical protein
MLGDIKNKKLLYAKGIIFVLTGSLSSALLLLKYPSLEVALLLGIAVWSFARAYYFAFYVIEHYVDPSFRYAGLSSFLKYLLSKKDKGEKDAKPT